MRINEVASAEEQMALWRLINQNVWAALDMQRVEQEQISAQKQAQKTATSKGRRASTTLRPEQRPAVQPMQSLSKQAGANAVKNNQIASVAAQGPTKNQSEYSRRNADSGAQKNTENPSKTLGFSQKVY